MGIGHNRVAVEVVHECMPPGSSCLATLG